MRVPTTEVGLNRSKSATLCTASRLSNGRVEVAASVDDRRVVLLQQVEAADLLLPGGPPRGQARRRCFRRSCEPRRMSG